MKSELHGILEIDHERGVIYFHHHFTGKTILRICRLPSPIPIPLCADDASKDMLLDITHMYGASWKGGEDGG